MLLLDAPGRRRTREPTDQAERSHTLRTPTGATARAWPVHARCCPQRLLEQLRWAAPPLDPDHPTAPAVRTSRARELVPWLHDQPSLEHPIAGCHRHRPA